MKQISDFMGKEEGAPQSSPVFPGIPGAIADTGETNDRSDTANHGPELRAFNESGEASGD